MAEEETQGGRRALGDDRQAEEYVTETVADADFTDISPDDRSATCWISPCPTS